MIHNIDYNVGNKYIKNKTLNYYNKIVIITIIHCIKMDFCINYNQQTLAINGDIIYNIMIQSELLDIISLCQVNKTFYSIYMDNRLWFDKFIIDYSYVTILTIKVINYKEEYIKIYKVGIITKILIELFNNEDKYIYVTDISISNIYWLPHHLMEILKNKAVSMYFYIENNQYIIKLNHHIIKGRNPLKVYSISLNEKEFIQFLILLLYHFPNVYLSDHHGCPYLYKNLINIPLRQDSGFRLEYWEKIYNKK